MPMRTVRYTPCIILLMGMLATAHAGGIYKWVDKDGVVHYGERPPTDNATEMKIRANRRLTEPGNQATNNRPGNTAEERDRMSKAMEGDRLAREETRKKQMQEAKKRAMQCARARDILRTYERARSLYRLDEKGNRNTLSDSARQAEIGRMQAKISKWCK